MYGNIERSSPILGTKPLQMKQFSTDPWEYNMNAYGAYGDEDLMLMNLF